VSLHTLVGSAVAGRIFHRSAPSPLADIAAAAPIAVPDATALGRVSMRILEAGLAVMAIATAVLLGLAR